MRLIIPALLAPALIAACTEMPQPRAPQSATVAPAPVAPSPAPVATPTPEPSQSASAGSSASANTGPGPLGTTVASLGDPARGGLWIRTPLTSTEGRARVTDTATGASVEVELLPLSGAAGSGSQISVEAMQALGAALTDLPTVRVTRL